MTQSLTLENALRECDEALESGQRYERLLGLLGRLERLPIPGTAQLWTRFFATMERILRHFDDATPVHVGYTRADHIDACVWSVIRRHLCSAGEGESTAGPLTKDEVRRRLLGPLLERRRSFAFPSMHLEWEVLRGGPSVFRSVFEDWISDLEAEELRPRGYLEGVKRAIDIQVAFRFMDDYSCVHEGPQQLLEKLPGWVFCEREFLPLLDSDHPHVRAAAAKVLGFAYRVDALRFAPGTPKLSEILALLGQKEALRGGVVGPFINGLDEDVSGLSVLDRDEELRSEGFDGPRYVLEILRKGTREPEFPNAQSFDFYVHEYFANDPGAVGELIEMGREDLAVDAATDMASRVTGMEGPLARLARSPDPRTAELARMHLERHYG